MELLEVIQQMGEKKVLMKFYLGTYIQIMYYLCIFIYKTVQLHIIKIVSLFI